MKPSHLGLGCDPAAAPHLDWRLPRREQTSDELALVHKEALNIKPEWQTSNRAGIPWHPGALKYFKEKGIKVE